MRQVLPVVAHGTPEQIKAHALTSYHCFHDGVHKPTFREEGSFSVFFYEHRFPVDPKTYPLALGVWGCSMGPAVGGCEGLPAAKVNMFPDIF